MLLDFGGIVDPGPGGWHIPWMVNLSFLVDYISPYTQIILVTQSVGGLVLHQLSEDKQYVSIVIMQHTTTLKVLQLFKKNIHMMFHTLY